MSSITTSAGASSWRRCLAQLAVAICLIVLAFAGTTRGAAAATLNNQCYVATSGAAHVLCWLDLTGYGLTGTTTIDWTLPDGSTLAGSLVDPSPTKIGGLAAFPTYSKAEIGNNIYLGVGGKPAVYGDDNYNGVPLQLSGLGLTNPAGVASPSFYMVGADAESVDTGDGGGVGYIDWTTTGAAWTVLQHTTNNGSGCTIQIGGSIGALNAQCLAPTTGGAPSDVYLLRSLVQAGQAVQMAYDTQGAENGYAFAIELASIDLTKTVVARVATSDQFTVQTQVGTKTSFTASTTGTGTTATTGAGAVVPGTTYTLDETASNGDLSSYATTIACTNATAGSTTTLPSGAGTSFTVTPAIDDQISCTFTNAPKASLTKSVTNLTNSNGTTTADTGKPGDSLQYGLTFTNITGSAIVATTAKPIVLTDVVPTHTGYLAEACTSPQNGMTCTVSAPAVGSTGTTITYTFTGTLAAGSAVSGTFNVKIQ